MWPGKGIEASSPVPQGNMSVPIAYGRIVSLACGARLFSGTVLLERALPESGCFSFNVAVYTVGVCQGQAFFSTQRRPRGSQPRHRGAAHVLEAHREVMYHLPNHGQQPLNDFGLGGVVLHRPRR